MSEFLKSILIFANLVAVQSVFASDSKTHSHSACVNTLAKNSGAVSPRGKVTVNALDEDDGGASLKHDAEIIADIAYRLGLEVPDHQINVVPSGQLNVLATSGGHSPPHWHAGLKVLQGLSGSMGILEFVTDGCPTCRAYYSASTQHHEQRSVVMHVAGHNDQSSTSIYSLMRPNDTPLASFHLAKTLSKAYVDNDRATVSLYYQFLQSIRQLQDFAYGTFEDPSKFAAKNAQMPLKEEAPTSFWDNVVEQGSSLFDSLKSPLKTKQPTKPSWTKTYSSLQALTEQLPPDAPAWQRDILKLFEQNQRPYPGNMQTKILNEGWATLMMYIIARHAPWTTSQDLVRFAQLVSGAVSPSFKNPYWLGLSGWMNLYEQFTQNDELSGLSEFEKDKRFIAWARNMYRDKNDSQWAKVALDRRWIEKHRFFLHRKTLASEMDRSQPPEKQERIALSRDWKRIRNHIIRRYIDAKYLMIPSISFKNPQLTNGHLHFKQEATDEGLPLELFSAAKTLFVIAQTFRKPAQIEALFAAPVSSGALTQIKAILGVTPDGRVQLPDDLPFVKGVLEEEIQKFKNDIGSSFSDSELNDWQIRQWTRLAAEVGDASSVGANQIVEYAPYTGPAIREYLQLVEQRLRQAVLNNKNPIIKGKTVRLKVLPEVPEFSFDRRFFKLKFDKVPPAPVDARTSAEEYDFNIDDNGTEVNSGPYLPGDKFGKKKQGGEGEGEGEGEGDGDGDGKGEGEGDGKGEGEGDGDGDGDGKGEGEGDGEGEPGDPSPGKGGGNPTELEIPLKLYGELLAEVLELPNIRRTQGDMARIQQIRRGQLHKPNGNVLWDEVIINAIEKARAIRRGKGLPYDTSVPVQDLVQEALPLLEPGDYVVSGHMDKPMPDFDAVLIVNVDLTGSMKGERIRLAKNLVYNMKALLLSKYAKVKMRFVGFSDTAIEMSEKDIFSKFIGGGTNYTSAIKLDRQILEEYPNAKYNKYVVTVGDGEVFDNDAATYGEELNECAKINR